MRTISREHFQMVLYALPNAILGLIAIIALGLEFGWKTLIELPFSLLIAWLIYTIILNFVYRWRDINNIKQWEREDYNDFLIELKDTITKAVQDGLKQRNDYDG